MIFPLVYQNLCNLQSERQNVALLHEHGCFLMPSSAAEIYICYIFISPYILLFWDLISCKMCEQPGFISVHILPSLEFYIDYSPLNQVPVQCVLASVNKSEPLLCTEQLSLPSGKQTILKSWGCKCIPIDPFLVCIFISVF